MYMRHASLLYRCSLALPVVFGLFTAPPALADDGFQWATVGAAGNQAYQGSGSSSSNGRGRVDYTYNISKLEITTAQWLEFTNTYSVQADQTGELDFIKYGPTYWGASLDTRYTGPGFKYKLSNAAGSAMRPVGGISWRDAARYCNWLTNGKSSSISALTTGAYDTTTFGTNPDGSFTDALTHLTTAKYWIPTLDEWMKAAYYDPNRFGNNVGGWWNYTNMSDGPGTSGLPGSGTTSAGLNLPNGAAWTIPLGAYPQSVSPWGLLDTSGGAEEWTEGFAPSASPRGRLLRGAGIVGSTANDEIAYSFSLAPGSGYPAGFRIASSVPTPASLCVLAFSGSVILSKRKRP